MGIKVENGKNGGEAMEVEDKAQHVQENDQNDSDEEYHGKQTTHYCFIDWHDIVSIKYWWSSNCFPEPGMRIGSDYQAVIPDIASDGKK